MSFLTRRKPIALELHPDDGHHKLKATLSLSLIHISEPTRPY